MLSYLDEYMADSEGEVFPVLNIAEIDFSNAVMARKEALTRVRCAAGGERIETKNSQGYVESVRYAEKGDAIFINLHNPDDMYLPTDAKDMHWKYTDLAQKNYDVISDPETGDVFVKSKTAYPVLREVITRPVCIKDAFGEGEHQFLYSGASLKRDQEGRVTGIDKEAFDATWLILPVPAAMQQKPKLQKPGF